MASPSKRTRHGEKYPWTDEHKLIFLHILVNWKATHGQTAAYKWPEIVEQFNSETKPPADKGILMNKLSNMKSEYTAWKNLVRSETGLGIDDDTGIILADGLWWKRKLIAHTLISYSEKPGLRRFRDEGVPKDVEDLYSQIFDGAMATGEHLAMPGMCTRAGHATEHDPNEEGQGERVGDPYFSLFNDENEGDDGTTPGATSSQMVVERASPHLIASRQGTSSAAQSKRRKTFTQTHEEAAQNISVMRGHVDKFMAMATSYTPPKTVTSPTPIVEERGPTVEQALAELHRLHIEEKIDGGKEFMGFAATHIGNLEHRRLFMGCPSDFLKVAYLEHNFKVAQGKM